MALDFLNKLLGKNDKKQESKEEKKIIIIEPYPYEGERKSLAALTDRQYEALYERIENMYDSYLEKVDDLEWVFNETESKSKRLTALKSTLKAFDRCYQKVAPYWYQDIYFMETLEIKPDDPWRTCSVEEAKNMSYNFNSIFCIMWLIKYYENN